MDNSQKNPGRRTLLKGISGAALLTSLAPHIAFSTNRFLEELELTPTMTEGPFYPDRMPLDTDNDLLVINDSLSSAVGEVTHLSGQVLSRAGIPVGNALVEIWQVDCHGAYLHSKGGNPQKPNQRDTHFQGYGRFLTDRKGRYYFRTIKPVAYPGRAPHIHFAVTINGKKVLSTQLLVRGHELNNRDQLWQAIAKPKQRELVLADFQKIPKSRIGELSAQFNLVIGHTPHEDEHG